MDVEPILIKLDRSIELVKSLIDKILENSMRKNEKIDDVWKIASELEYISSLLSIIFELGDYYPDFDNSEDMNITKLMINIKESLNDINEMIRKDPKEGYKIIRSAIHNTRIVQNKVELFKK